MNKVLLNTIFMSCLFLVACKKKEKPVNTEVPVNLMTVKAKRVLYYDKYPATTQALSQVNLLPQISGAITAIYFKEGGHVSKGQKLYEIDKRIEDLARTYYSYLRFCPQVEVRIGDGRIRLEKELRDGKIGKYDVFLVDAFSDDSVPAHLLTKEAVQTYLSHLRSHQSVIAIHISSRFFTLAPVLKRIAIDLGISSRVVDDSPSRDQGLSTSQWVVLSEDPAVLESNYFPKASTSSPETVGSLWSDDYTNMWGVVRFPSLFR